MKNRTLSCLNLLDAYKSINDILGISQSKVNKYLFSLNDGTDISLKDIIDLYNATEIKEIRIDYVLVSHLTTASAYDKCAYIKNNGLTNTRKVLVNNTPMNQFLKNHMIQVKNENDTYELYYNDNYINIRDKKNLSKSLLSYKLEKDSQINTIFYTANIINYGNVKHFPEIIADISNLVPICLEDFWEEMTSPYILTIRLKLNQIGSITFLENTCDEFTEIETCKWLLEKSLRYIYDLLLYNSTYDTYIFLKDNMDIQPQDIINIQQV
ncbi:MAG TPA: hypothetical protein VIK86_02230 [Candidatus Paceibacterota bacterium]